MDLLRGGGVRGEAHPLALARWGAIFMIKQKQKDMRDIMKYT